jgi:hypothetical protein
MTSNNGDDLERVLRENVELRRQVVAEFSRSLTVGQRVREWWTARFGRSDDQPLIFALLLVLIAITIYAFA